ncbi:MAG: hypothetical protein AAF548_12950 [Actinomycetota bacterium]
MGFSEPDREPQCPATDSFCPVGCRLGYCMGADPYQSPWFEALDIDPTDFTWPATLTGLIEPELEARFGWIPEWLDKVRVRLVGSSGGAAILVFAAFARDLVRCDDETLARWLGHEYPEAGWFGELADWAVLTGRFDLDPFDI